MLPRPLVPPSTAFTCSGAASSSAEPPQTDRLDFTSVVVGVLGNGHQLDRIYSTWLPELLYGKVYLMVDACTHADTSLSMHRRAQSRSAHDGPTIKLDCFAPPMDQVAVGTPFAGKGTSWLQLPRLNRTNTLWVKAAAFLRGMWAAYPRQRWYLKADEDTLLLPRSLSRFFAALAGLPAHLPLYLGNVASTKPLGLLSGAAAAGLPPISGGSVATAGLQPGRGCLCKGAPPGCGGGEDASGAVQYAVGGAGYVFNEPAMRIVAGVEADGGPRVEDGLLAAVRFYYDHYSHAHGRRTHGPAAPRRADPDAAAQPAWPCTYAGSSPPASSGRRPRAGIRSARTRPSGCGCTSHVWCRCTANASTRARRAPRAWSASTPASASCTRGGARAAARSVSGHCRCTGCRPRPSSTRGSPRPGSEGS